jgi:hypothetical protein
MAKASEPLICEPVQGDEFLERSNHCLIIAEAEFNAVRLFEPDEPLLKTLHGKPDSNACAHVIDAELIAELACGDNRLHLVHAAFGTEGIDTFPL